VNCGNGTVTDSVTGLIWLRDAGCLDIASYPIANQRAAALAAGTCNLTDGSRPGDWRLPTKAEWAQTIARAIALGCAAPSSPLLTNDSGLGCLTDNNVPAGGGFLAGSSFVGVEADHYYARDANQVTPFDAWYVKLQNGTFDTAGKGNERHVWPVRDGK
jgi:hypothetical protein